VATTADTFRELTSARSSARSASARSIPVQRHTVHNGTRITRH
jgi:hypothetical protein